MNIQQLFSDLSAALDQVHATKAVADTEAASAQVEIAKAKATCEAIVAASEQRASDAAMAYGAAIDAAKALQQQFQEATSGLLNMGAGRVREA